MNPGDGSGWDEPPLDVQIPDDARELERDVLAYHRELRARRRRHRLRRLTAPLRGPGTVMPLLASILAVCLVAGAMLSVATFSPATGPEHHDHPSATQTAGTRTSATQTAATQTAATQRQSAQNASSAASTTATSATASPSAGARVTARPSSSANSSAVSSTGYRVPASQVRPGTSGSP